MRLKNVMASLVPKHNVAHFENFVGYGVELWTKPRLITTYLSSFILMFVFKISVYPGYYM